MFNVFNGGGLRTYVHTAGVYVGHLGSRSRQGPCIVRHCGPVYSTSTQQVLLILFNPFEYKNVRSSVKNIDGVLATYAGKMYKLHAMLTSFLIHIALHC